MARSSQAIRDVTAGNRRWAPAGDWNAVQIGDFVARRRGKETAAQLLDRAIREFPDKTVAIATVGWRD